MRTATERLSGRPMKCCCCWSMCGWHAVTPHHVTHHHTTTDGRLFLSGHWLRKASRCCRHVTSQATPAFHATECQSYTHTQWTHTHCHCQCYHAGLPVFTVRIMGITQGNGGTSLVSPSTPASVHPLMTLPRMGLHSSPEDRIQW